jgi:hypothetical protein
MTARLPNDLERAQCPCMHTTPCHARCSCVMPLSSSGCRRCCAYGSAEQQAATATRLAAFIDLGWELRDAITNITNEQIRTLRDWALRLQADTNFVLLCEERGEVKSPTLLREIDKARERCAAILKKVSP